MQNETMIELTQVSRHFVKGPETIHAVDNVSFGIHRGDFIAIQGPSGSGKSTLLHLIGALDWPTQGKVSFDGHEISDLSDRVLSRLRRERFGFVFQAFNLISDLSVLQNVALPLKYGGMKRIEREERARKVLEAVDMSHRLSHYPSELSGGEEQRVAIARALVNHPDVILADEPTGNLDTANRDGLLDLFADLHANGQTIIVVTHDMKVTQKVVSRYWMQNGKLSRVE
jgi:putative ABC transport system ATP-binding protein